MEQLELKQFNPFDLATNLLSCIKTERNREIAAGFFGMRGKIESLANLGRRYQITRERVRQINQRNRCLLTATAQQNPQFRKFVKSLEGEDFINERSLFERFSCDNKEKEGAITLLMALTEAFIHLKNHSEFKNSYLRIDTPIEEIKNINQEILSYLDREKKELSVQEIVSYLKSRTKPPFFKPSMIKVILKNSLFFHPAESKKWGLSSWGHLNPKNAADRAYIALKKNKKPLHFKKIPEAIQKLNLRPSRCQAVHNELIRDKRFVLIGRGRYALKEWGYPKGTILELMEAILKEEKLIHRNILIGRISAVREIKRGSILSNLRNNKHRFKTHPKHSNFIYLEVEAL